eukprot:CAMPEP_0119052016 /NCGR_PEP_ID=MMETSP1177-20130426/73449_1 /TAXON_ID=2985 /ORGANISM="Ochromonas sp, Strain CCMP1899" /LENGTH=639 /DNA_ID=CAMNT_0007031441 /DNA_START=267 /DNA_END=2187 /DNA_ORIENTATION=+
MTAKRSIKECLLVIGVTETALESCRTLDEQFEVIKQMYFIRVRIDHPDKGGDAEIFHGVHESYVLIREAYDKKSIDSFVTSDKKKKSATKDFSDCKKPSSEFYQSAYTKSEEARKKASNTNETSSKFEAELRAREEAERKATEAKARKDAERKATEARAAAVREAEVRAREVAERKARAEAAAVREAEVRAREEADRKATEARAAAAVRGAEVKARKDAERKATEANAASSMYDGSYSEESEKARKDAERKATEANAASSMYDGSYSDRVREFEARVAERIAREAREAPAAAVRGPEKVLAWKEARGPESGEYAVLERKATAARAAAAARGAEVRASMEEAYDRKATETRAARAAAAVREAEVKASEDADRKATKANAASSRYDKSYEAHREERAKSNRDTCNQYGTVNILESMSEGVWHFIGLLPYYCIAALLFFSFVSYAFASAKTIFIYVLSLLCTAALQFFSFVLYDFESAREMIFILVLSLLCIAALRFFWFKMIAQMFKDKRDSKKLCITLKCVGGPHIGQRFRLQPNSADGEDVFKMGRSTGKLMKERGVSLYKDKEISTTHAKIEIRNAQVFLVDARSTNGTQLNNVDVEAQVPLRLREEDVITMGTTELMVHITDLEDTENTENNSIENI